MMPPRLRNLNCLAMAWAASKFVLKIRTNLYELYKYKYESIELPEDILDVLEIFTKQKDMFEWDYPYKNNYNIFIECRDIENFILLSYPSFYIKNILTISVKDINNVYGLLKNKNFDKFFYQSEELIKFRYVSIEYLYSYCECVINILDKILNIGIDTPQWSFGK